MSFSLPSNMEYNVESAAVKQVSAKQVSAKQVSAKQVSAKQVSAKQVSAKQVSAKQVSAKQVSAKQVSAKQVSAKQVSAKQVSAAAKPTFIDTRPECCTRHPQGYCEHARRGPTTSYTTPVEYDSDDEELMAFRSRNRF